MEDIIKLIKQKRKEFVDIPETCKKLLEKFEIKLNKAITDLKTIRQTKIDINKEIQDKLKNIPTLNQNITTRFENLVKNKTSENGAIVELDKAVKEFNKSRRAVQEAETAVKTKQTNLKNANDELEKVALGVYVNDCLGPQSKYEIDVHGIKSIMDNTMCPFTFNCKNIYGESVGYANTIFGKEYKLWGDLVEGIKCKPCLLSEKNAKAKAKAKALEQGGGGASKEMIAVLIAHHKKSNKKEKEKEEEKEEEKETNDIASASANDSVGASVNQDDNKGGKKEKEKEKDDDGQSRCYCEPIKAVTSALLQIKQNKQTNPNCFIPYANRI